jgi:protein-disulfide isomerase
VIVFLAGAVSAVAFFPSEASLRAKAAQQAAQPATADQRSEFERFWEAQPRITVPVPSDGAAVVIVKFTDLQCPACGQSFFDARPILSKYQAQYPGAVKFIAKDYPLQPDCNSNVLRPMHTAACDAAVAVRLARQRNKGEALEEYFYSHQPTMSPATVREAAQTIAGVLDLDLQYPRVIESVKADVGLGRLLNVRQTPTFFINGVKLEGATAQAIDMAIAYELKKAGKIK